MMATIETASQTAAPALLIHIQHHRAARGLGHAVLRTCVTDPAHAIRLDELSEREAAEEALDSDEIYSTGRVSWCAGMNMFAATVPAGLVQRFLGYHPRLETAQRAIRTHELAAGLGTPRQAHKKKTEEED